MHGVHVDRVQFPAARQAEVRMTSKGTRSRAATRAARSRHSSCLREPFEVILTSAFFESLRALNGKKRGQHGVALFDGDEASNDDVRNASCEFFAQAVLS